MNDRDEGFAAYFASRSGAMRGTAFLLCGDWVRLFVANGLEVVDLIEPRPDPDATSTFWDDEGRDWARRWPAEQLWSVRKRR